MDENEVFICQFISIVWLNEDWCLWQLLTVMMFMSCVEFCLEWDAFGQDLN